jgi:hypothetical protein
MPVPAHQPRSDPHKPDFVEALDPGHRGQPVEGFTLLVGDGHDQGVQLIGGLPLRVTECPCQSDRMGGCLSRNEND